MMGSSPLANFTLSSTFHPKNHFSSLHTHAPSPHSLPSSPKPSLLLSLSHSTQSPTLLRATHVSPIPPPPSSPRARIRTSLPMFVSEQLVVLILGSFLFMAALGARPALALASHRSGAEARSEEPEEAEEPESGPGSDSEELYLKALEADPRNVEALKVALYGKMKKGATKEAVRYVERLIEIEPAEAEWRLLQALCYETMGHLSKAKRLFREVLKKWPFSLRALHGLAMVMHKNREGPAVFEMLNKALEIAQREKRVSEERNIRILIAQMRVVKGDMEGGLENFQVLIDENPRDFRPYLCRGIIYSLLDKKHEAEECFEIYRSLVPEEFPQRCFLDDVVLTAKTKPPVQLQKEFKAVNSYWK